jgi:hypothetical protein
MFWQLGRTAPAALFFAIVGVVARFLERGGEWRPAERAAHLLWVGWVLWFGVIESGLTTNYLLLPVSFMLIAIAVDLDAILRHNRSLLPPSTVSRVADGGLHFIGLTIIVAVIALDQWQGEGSIAGRLEAARPTIHVEGIDEIRQSLQPSDRVVCTDELGCLMLVGRIDRWLALDEYVRERFLVRRSPARMTGVYTGVPAVFRPGEVFGPNENGTLPDRTIVIDIFKEYPIGNSRSWLPKAIEEDGLQVRPLLETPQARVLQVSPPERLARLR